MYIKHASIVHGLSLSNVVCTSQSISKYIVHRFQETSVYQINGVQICIYSSFHDIQTTVHGVHIHINFNMHNVLPPVDHVVDYAVG